MKKVLALVLCLSLVLGMGVAYAREYFSDVKLEYSNSSTYKGIISDTTSVANPERARMYITSNTSSVNSVFRAGLTSDGSAVTRLYYDRITSGRMMYYDQNIAENTRVYLQGRPDSSVSTCTISGSFGAG